MARSKRLRRGAVAVVAAALVLTPGAASAAPGDDGRVTISEGSKASPDLTGQFVNTKKWFIELKGEPTSSGGSRTVINQQHRQLEADARSEGVSISRKFTSLFNGVTVEADAEQARALGELGEVKNVFPVIPVAIPESQESKPAMFTAGQMTGADTVRSELGITGAGIKVGIIDTGIDIDHPDFGGNGTDGSTTFPTTRVAFGYDFVGDDYNADPASPSFNPIPRPDGNPDDCQGHGTHVAGIVGADGEVTGVAPDVTLGAYRVFGCDGSTDTDIILAALERAEADGMDVVNMSLGAGFQSWPQYPTSTASDRLWRNGIVVVASAGNEGATYGYQNTQSLGAPGVAGHAIGVASFDNIAVRMSEIVFTPASGAPISTGYLPATASPAIGDTVNGLAVAPLTDPLGCAAGGDVAGKIAIVSRGTCSFHQKAVAAQESGAKALVIYNNQAGTINATVEGDTEITIPVVTITQDAGQAIVAALPVGVTASVTGGEVSIPNPNGGLISSFSSWGLAADLTLKPDLGAPGGSIYSSYPVELGSHVTMSGTSMSAPHVAGAVALLLDANGDLTPDEVLHRLQNTAAPAVSPEAKAAGLEVLDAAHRQGAGLIQIDKAILSDSVVSPGKISAGEGDDGPFTQRLTISNAGDAAVTWELSYEDGISTGIDPDDDEEWQNAPDLTIEEAEVTFSSPEVTVPAGGTATVDVTVAAPSDAREGTQYSGFVQLTSDEGGATLSVPFAGMAGDYGNLNLFPSLGLGLPAVVEVDCGIWDDQQCVDPEAEFAPAAAGKVFKGNGDNPSVALHLAYPARSLTLEVLKADASGQPVESSASRVFKSDYVGRSGSLDLYSWDGRVRAESGLMVAAAPGKYVLRFTAEEADGDGGEQVWTSDAFQYGVVAPKPTPTPSVPVPTQPPVVQDVYNTPGYHNVNGRRWLTTCEKYSKTTRCRTSIWATTVAQVDGRFVNTNGWVFNNLTYLPGMTRAQWAGNPLGHNGSWIGSDGRKWRTECDTAATGRNGCRTFITASVISGTQGADGKFTYRWVTKEILNNMVRFKI